MPQRSQAEICAQAVDRSACGVIGGVPVHVASNRDGRVPEQVRDGLDVHAALKPPDRSRVPQGVDADTLDASGLGGRLDHA